MDHLEAMTDQQGARRGPRRAGRPALLNVSSLGSDNISPTIKVLVHMMI